MLSRVNKGSRKRSQFRSSRSTPTKRAATLFERADEVIMILREVRVRTEGREVHFKRLSYKRLDF